MTAKNLIEDVNEFDEETPNDFTFGDYSEFNALIERTKHIITSEKDKWKLKEFIRNQQTMYNIMKDDSNNAFIMLAVQPNIEDSFNLGLYAKMYDDQVYEEDFPKHYNKYQPFIIMKNNPSSIIDLAIHYSSCNYAVYEIIRSNYSKLMFDIDCDEANKLPQLDKTLEIIFKLTEIFNSSLTGGIVIRDENLYNEITTKYKSQFEEVIITKQPMYKGLKLLSGHVQIKGLYFNRNDLKDILFKGLTPQKLKQFNLTKDVFDVSIFKHAGSQQNFRFFFSLKPGKTNSEIDLDDNERDYILNNPTYFISQRNINDKFVSSTDTRFIEAINYIEKTFADILTNHTPKSKKQAKDMISTSASNFDINSLHDYIKHNEDKHHQLTDYDKWRITLMKEMEAYRYKNPNCTYEDLYNEFIKEEHQRFSQSQNKIIINPSCTQWTVGQVMEKKINLNSFFSYNHEIYNEFHEFNKLIKKGHVFNLLELMTYINNTFVFFTNQSFMNYCMIKEEGENKIIQVSEILEDKQLIVKVSYINDSKSYISNLKLGEILPFIQTCQNCYDKYDIYSDNDNVFHLYNLPIKSDEEVELDEETRAIISLLCNDDEEGIEYVLDWFAYMLQHPENKNHTALHFVSKIQGTGKNTITNMLCDFLGEFSVANAYIEDVFTRFNGIIDNKKLIVINECPAGKKQTDLIKSFITEDKAKVEKKGIDQKEKYNLANLIILSNNFDTGLIENGDRRFSFFYCKKDVYTKEFYESYYNNREEHYNNFIKFLLSRDLSNYDKDTHYEKAKAELIENRQLLRHPVYKLIEYLELPELTICQLKNIIRQIIEPPIPDLEEEESEDSSTKCDKNIIEKLNKISDELKQELIDNKDHLNHIEIKDLINLVHYQNNPNYEMKGNGKNTVILNTKIKFDYVTNEIIELLDQNKEHKILLKDLVEKYKSNGLTYVNYKARLSADKFSFETINKQVYVVKNIKNLLEKVKTYFDKLEPNKNGICEVSAKKFTEEFPELTNGRYKKFIEGIAKISPRRKDGYYLIKIQQD